MGYYVDILGTHDHEVSISYLRRCFAGWHLLANIHSVNEEGEKHWSQLEVFNYLFQPICSIERLPVNSGQPGVEYVQEYVGRLDDVQPVSAEQWLREFLPRVKVLYTFQLLHGCWGPGWLIYMNVLNFIRRKVGGIIHADGEGFTNQLGDYITWDFSERAIGREDVAVLSPAGKWLRFSMDLSNPEHRTAFQNGSVPIGVKLQ